jgi:hypothetical protein
VLGVDEPTHPARHLRLGDDVEGQRRFTGGLRAVDLDHAATRNATHADGKVQTN